MIEHPEVTVGPIIQNKEGKIFLVKTHKISGGYSVHGGHVKAGETIEEAAVRETKEETGLDTEVVKVIGFNQWINANFIPKKPVHYIQFTVLLKLKDETQEVKLNDEASEYTWASPEEILEREEFSRYAKELVKQLKG